MCVGRDLLAVFFCRLSHLSGIQLWSFVALKFFLEFCLGSTGKLASTHGAGMQAKASSSPLKAATQARICDVMCRADSKPLWPQQSQSPLDRVLN